ncbi:MAG: 4-hydroxy-tetrahydrodipicolinate reductase [Deltaproteobacteria bacterium]|nr:4-hydroxy-tetrahydrodipicolinate reductase [Deltaproteobacteria bacterium]
MTLNKTGIILNGCAGRMGRNILTLLDNDDELYLAAALEARDHPLLGKDVSALIGKTLPGKKITCEIPSDALTEGNVLLDFSTPASTMERLAITAEAGIPAVVGTTGFTKEQQKMIRHLSAKAAVVWAPNMSIGVNLLFKLAQDAASCLGPGFEAEIVELHHDKKKDSPSGTALRLAEAVRSAREDDCDLVFGRHGKDLSRKPLDVGIHSIRAGDIVGEHTLILAGQGERLELTHRCSSRVNFALGALRAAFWIRDKEPGLYDMMDVLGLK